VKSAYQRKPLILDFRPKKRAKKALHRYFWLDNLPNAMCESPTQTNQINKMVNIFDKLAVVQAKPGVSNDPNFPF